MIVLDTHIWLWWLNDSRQLTPSLIETLQSNEAGGFVISAISCWEVALKASRGALELGVPVQEWIGSAVDLAGIRVEPISSEIAVESVMLPGELHRDPADRIIVATARILDCPLVTLDGKLLNYPHVIHA